MIKLACLAGLIGAVSLTAQQQAVASAPKVPTEMANAYLPRWIQLNGEARYREEGFFGNRFTEGNDDMYLLQRFRLGVRLQPAPWLGFYVQAAAMSVSKGLYDGNPQARTLCPLDCE